MKKIFVALTAMCFFAISHGQYFANPYQPTTAEERLAAYKTRIEMQENSMVKQVSFRNVGPTVMSGRVVDIDVSPDDPTIFYVAYASGGLWKTENNGQSFTPVFDDQAVMTIGDIAIDWKNGETIWVGTGENNSSRSSYAGVGIYKSTDKGKSWEFSGLGETHRTGRIILHPENPDVVWVAALGALYSPNTERGVYKTTDGGKTWSKTLYVDDNTGAIDLVIHPTNPDVLYASMWERTRRAWNFTEGGKGSGIYQSTDGGETWTKISGGKTGFPEGDGVGRIGLAIYPQNPNVIYAFLDNQFHTEKKKSDKEEGLSKEDFRTMSDDTFLKLDNKLLGGFLRQNGFPRKYTAQGVKQMVKARTIKPNALVEYLEDANALLFDTPVKGAEIYRSDDGGKSWRKTHDEPLEGVVYTYGYYFGEVRVSALNPDKIYVLGVPIIMSEDGGKTFTSIGGSNVHSDHQALWVNPEKDGHLINGNDGGLNITYDDGAHWYKGNNAQVGQFYAVSYDMEEPYNVYGGLQDNGVWFGSSSYTQSSDWHSSGHYPYTSLNGGDGMQVQVDFRDNETLYTGSQFGYYSRINRHTGERMSIKPIHDLGERPLRFNWQTPIHLSRHNQDVLYLGSNKFHRSLNKGENFDALSGDLTNGGIKGDVSYGTLTTIDESPLRFGLIYIGTDDGNIQISKDGGYNWELISNDLPNDLWVSHVDASHHKLGRVYASLNGYRWDYFDSFVYMSDDFGKTWKRIGLDLPKEAVNVVYEDPKNENLIYVGTDHGLYVSLDMGNRFMAFSKNLPHVAVHDLEVHPRDNDLIVGTHGRSIFIADINELQQLSADVLAKPLHVFSLDEVSYSPYWGRQWSQWWSAGEMTETIAFYSRTSGAGSIVVKTKEGNELFRQELTIDKGLNYFDYALSVAEKNLKKYEKEISGTISKADNGLYYLQKGTYTIEVSVNGNIASTGLNIK